MHKVGETAQITGCMHWECKGIIITLAFYSTLIYVQTEAITLAGLLYRTALPKEYRKKCLVMPVYRCLSVYLPIRPCLVLDFLIPTF